MKPARFVGNSKATLQTFSESAKNELGHQLLSVQIGNRPEDWKPMPSIGRGAMEIRVHTENEYRLIYVAKFPEAIYVLHVFVKKSQKTPVKDIQIARTNYEQVQERRKNGLV